MEEMLRTLIRRSFAASRLRNLIAVLAIALSAVLFTSVTAIGLGTMQSITLTGQMQKGSKSDGDIQNMTAGQFEALRRSGLVEKAGLRQPVGFLSNSNRHNTEFDVLDEIQAELTFCLPRHGRVPQAANEIVASDRALSDLGAEPEVGAEVVIELSAHGRVYRLPMTVSGWYEAANDQLSIMWAGTAFREAYPDIFEYTYDRDREIAGTYFSDFTASGTAGLEEKLKEWVRSQGGSTEDMGATNYMPVIINRRTNPPLNPGMVLMGAALAALFVFCGYLLIYNVFDIAVMQEIQRYGLYRTIGMSRVQVRKLINRQALWLSCIGIPIGLIIGFIIGKAALPVIMNLFVTEYSNIAADVSPSPLLFFGATLLTAITVCLSTRKPVRTAANIPPIEAFHYTESSAGGRASKKSAYLASIPKLAWANLGRNKRRSVFIIVSLMLCIVLLNCTGTAAGSVDIEKQVSYMTRTDFSVVNTVSTNGRKGFTHREQALKQQTISDIAAQPGVKEGTAVYKNTAEDTDVTYEFGHELTDQGFFNEDSGLNFQFDENFICFGTGSDGRPVCNVYGMEEIAVARMDLREGETDAGILYEKMEAGEGILAGVPVNRVDMSLNRNLDFVDIGDVITVYKDGRPFLELPVLAKAAVNGDDLEIGYTCNGPNEIGGDGLYLYLPDSIYKHIYEEPVIYKYSFNVEEGQRERTAEFLDQYMSDTDNSINYLSSQSAYESAENFRDMIHFVGGTVGVIFGIAGVLNLINTLITTILTRRHEFATMQSIGMTKRQLTKMMVFEGISYAACACAAGIMMAALLNLTLVKNMLDNVWQFSFHFTLLPALVVCALLMVLSAIVPAAALELFHKGTIVEQLRVTE